MNKKAPSMGSSAPLRFTGLDKHIGQICGTIAALFPDDLSRNTALPMIIAHPSPFGQASRVRERRWSVNCDPPTRVATHVPTNVNRALFGRIYPCRDPLWMKIALQGC